MLILQYEPNMITSHSEIIEFKFNTVYSYNSLAKYK